MVKVRNLQAVRDFWQLGQRGLFVNKFSPIQVAKLCPVESDPKVGAKNSLALLLVNASESIMEFSVIAKCKASLRCY